MKKRMKSCGKRAYRDGIAAKLALAEIAHKDRPSRDKTEKRTYRCPDCRNWHLTSRGA